MRRTPAGLRRHRVTLFNPGAPVPDGDGGFEASFAPLTPSAVNARIEPATARDLERKAAGTVIATASHIVTMPYHPAVTVDTLVLFNGRQFNVVGVANPEERNVETIAVCVELTNAPMVDYGTWAQMDFLQIGPPFVQENWI